MIYEEEIRTNGGYRTSDLETETYYDDEEDYSSNAGVIFTRSGIPGFTPGTGKIINITQAGIKLRNKAREINQLGRNNTHVFPDGTPDEDTAIKKLYDDYGLDYENETHQELCTKIQAFESSMLGKGLWEGITNKILEPVDNLMSLVLQSVDGVIAKETISKGSFVYIFEETGVLKCRKASCGLYGIETTETEDDWTWDTHLPIPKILEYQAFGFIDQDVTAGNEVTVIFQGYNENFITDTTNKKGDIAYLDIDGKVRNDLKVGRTISQKIGFWIDDETLLVHIEQSKTMSEESRVVAVAAGNLDAGNFVKIYSEETTNGAETKIYAKCDKADVRLFDRYDTGFQLNCAVGFTKYAVEEGELVDIYSRGQLDTWVENDDLIPSIGDHAFLGDDGNIRIKRRNYLNYNELGSLNASFLDIIPEPPGCFSQYLGVFIDNNIIDVNVGEPKILDGVLFGTAIESLSKGMVVNLIGAETLVFCRKADCAIDGGHLVNNAYGSSYAVGIVMDDYEYGDRCVVYTKGVFVDVVFSTPLNEGRLVFLGHNGNIQSAAPTSIDEYIQVIGFYSSYGNMCGKLSLNIGSPIIIG